MIYGIDIGGTKIEIAVFSSDMKKLDHWRVKTPTHSFDEFIQVLLMQIDTADKKFQCSGLVGLGMPGLINSHGLSISANIPCANGQNVQRALAMELKRPVAIANDCRCFALSEANASGAGEGYRRVYGAIIGTGAAGGLCIDAKLDEGPNNIMGEYGHVPLPGYLKEKYQLTNYTCGCGLQDCMEKFISGPGLSFIYSHISGKSANTREILNRFEEGERTANRAIGAYLDLLGYTFSQIIHHYDPNIIVLGGGMSNIDYIINNLSAYIRPYVFDTIELPVIKRAHFGDSSGGRGAAMLAKIQLESL